MRHVCRQALACKMCSSGRLHLCVATQAIVGAAARRRIRGTPALLDGLAGQPVPVARGRPARAGAVRGRGQGHLAVRAARHADQPGGAPEYLTLVLIMGGV